MESDGKQVLPLRSFRGTGQDRSMGADDIDGAALSECQFAGGDEDDLPRRKKENVAANCPTITRMGSSRFTRVWNFPTAERQAQHISVPLAGIDRVKQERARE